MAMADYWICDVCEGKSFYDATLDWDYAREQKSARKDGRMIPEGSWKPASTMRLLIS